LYNASDAARVCLVFESLVVIRRRVIELSEIREDVAEIVMGNRYDFSATFQFRSEFDSLFICRGSPKKIAGRPHRRGGIKEKSDS
jgi:hypothetical protein